MAKFEFYIVIGCLIIDVLSAVSILDSLGLI